MYFPGSGNGSGSPYIMIIVILVLAIILLLTIGYQSGDYKGLVILSTILYIAYRVDHTIK